jgi:hypothetical protein
MTTETFRRLKFVGRQFEEEKEVIVGESEEGVLVMRKIKEPVKAMRGFKKSSVELVRELRRNWDKRLENLTKG